MLWYIFNDHDEEGQFDAKGLLVLLRAGDEGGGDIGAHDLKYRGLNILIGEPFDVSVVYCMWYDLLCLSHI